MRPVDGRLVLLDLSRPLTPRTTAYLSRFMPELVALRSEDRLVAIGPTAVAPVAHGWGVTRFVTTSWRLEHQGARRGGTVDGLRPDVVIGPEHGMVWPGVPRLGWAAGHPEGRGLGDRPESIRTRAARGFGRRPDRLLHATVASRKETEDAGDKIPGLVARPPLRHRQPASSASRADGPLRILVPLDDGPAHNLALVRRLSVVLDQRGVDHHLLVEGDYRPETVGPHASMTGPDPLGSWADPGDRVDAIFLPHLQVSCLPILVDAEATGLPVAASAIDAHRELRSRTALFDPASSHGAADALLAAVERGRSDAVDLGWRVSTPDQYADLVATEIDAVMAGRQLSWEV